MSYPETGFGLIPSKRLPRLRYCRCISASVLAAHTTRRQSIQLIIRLGLQEFILGLMSDAQGGTRWVGANLLK
jgi:hypothetical protein